MIVAVKHATNCGVEPLLQMAVDVWKKLPLEVQVSCGRHPEEAIRKIADGLIVKFAERAPLEEIERYAAALLAMTLQCALGAP